MSSPAYDKDELLRRLQARILEVCEHLLPNGEKVGREWKVGSVEGEPGDSLGVALDGPKLGMFNDRATGGGGDIFKLWMQVRGVDFKGALEEAAAFCGLPSTAPFPMRATKSKTPAASEEPAAVLPEYDWKSCVAALADMQLLDVAAQRGFTEDFTRLLRDHQMIGSFNGHIAFPVHDEAGRVVKCHYKVPDGGWKYDPTGLDRSTFPLILGDAKAAEEVWTFESQWDAFAVADRLGFHEGRCDHVAFYITRGATNWQAVESLSSRISPVAKVIAFPQNDPQEKRAKSTGLTPAETWMQRLLSANGNSRLKVLEARTPAAFKDANDWTRGGATPADILQVVSHAKGVAPFLRPSDLLNFNPGADTSCLLGNRWLCCGGSCLWVGTSGIGKSTLAMQAAIYWAMGELFMGIRPARNLKSLFIQAENDDGDMAEMLQGVVRGIASSGNLGTASEIAAAIEPYVVFVREPSRSGEDFTNFAGAQAEAHHPDLVWVDPALSFVGDDMREQRVISKFFRNQLNPIAIRLGFAWMIIHHTGKPPRMENGRSHQIEELEMYEGLGSSDLVNWARAITVLKPVGEGRYRLAFAKRGKRAGATGPDGGPEISIYLKHGGEGLFWEQCDPPTPEEVAPSKQRRANDKIDAAKYHLGPLFQKQPAWRLADLEKELSSHHPKTVQGYFYGLRDAGFLTKTPVRGILEASKEWLPELRRPEPESPASEGTLNLRA